MLSQQIFYPFTTEPKCFQNKSFTLLQQNKSAFTTNLLPFHNKTKTLSQQIFYPFATEPKHFQNKTKDLKQQNKSS